jgi:hypothetical protein
MPGDPRELRLYWLFVAFGLGATGLVLACAAGPGQNSHAGPVTGVIDGIQFEGDQYFVHGWACQEGQRGSVDVHIYANASATANTLPVASTA